MLRSCLFLFIFQMPKHGGQTCRRKWMHGWRWERERSESFAPFLEITGKSCIGWLTVPCNFHVDLPERQGERETQGHSHCSEVWQSYKGTEVHWEHGLVVSSSGKASLKWSILSEQSLITCNHKTCISHLNVHFLFVSSDESALARGTGQGRKEEAVPLEGHD